MVASGADLVEYGLDAMFDDEAYQVWLAEEADRERVRELDLSDLLGEEPAAPTISVLVPVYRPRLELLEACVASVRRQLYDRWELASATTGPAMPS